MGTNFYHITRSGFLGLFGKTEERHIGKRSSGWRFSFRGYNDEKGRRIIGSWQDWKRLLKRGKIVDEYGRRWSYSEFVEKVEMSKAPGFSSHYDEILNSPKYGASFLQDDWKDEEGWSFSTTEFC